jgi:hypothetical protein
MVTNRIVGQSSGMFIEKVERDRALLFLKE